MNCVDPLPRDVANESGRRSGRFVAQTDSYVNTFGDSTIRQFGQLTDDDLFLGNICQYARTGVVEVMVVLGIRIVEHIRRIYDDLVHQPLPGVTRTFLWSSLRTILRPVSVRANSPGEDTLRYHRVNAHVAVY